MIQSINIDRNFKGSEELKKLLTFDYDSPLYKKSDADKHLLGRFFGKLKNINKLEFKPGINLIYARNGSGKSTILDIISYLFHSRQNYSSHVTHSSTCHLIENICKLPLLQNDFTIMDILKLIKIEHDGQSVHYFDPEHMVGLTHKGHGFDHDFSCMEGGPTQNGSSGQQILMRLEQFFGNTETEIKYQKGHKSNYKEEMKNSWKGELNFAFHNEFLKTSFEPGPVTYLLDEPTRSLDTLHEADFWNIIEGMRDKQVIIATHSPFGLFMKDVNYVELEPGYVEQCRKWFKQH